MEKSEDTSFHSEAGKGTLQTSIRHQGRLPDRARETGGGRDPDLGDCGHTGQSGRNQGGRRTGAQGTDRHYSGSFNRQAPTAGAPVASRGPAESLDGLKRSPWLAKRATGAFPEPPAESGPDPPRKKAGAPVAPLEPGDSERSRRSV
jgi:hypothetical protein